MTGSGKLGKSYGKYGSNPDRIKTIRVTEEQELNWDPDLIRSVLEGSRQSNDSIRISKLKEDKEVLMKFFEMVIINLGEQFDKYPQFDKFMLDNERIFRGK